MKNKKVILIFSALILISFGYYLYSKQTKVELPETITIALSNNKPQEQIQSEIDVMTENFAQQGQDVEFVVVGKDVAMEGLSSGSIDAAMLTAMDAYNLYNEDIASPVIQEQRYNPDPVTGEYDTTEAVNYYLPYLITPVDSDIEELSDLEGKTVCTTKSTTSMAQYIYPTLALDDVGIDMEEDLTLIKGGFADELVIKMLDGVCDAAFIFQDIRTDMTEQFPNIFEQTKVIPLEDYPVPNTILMVSNKYDQSQQEAIGEFFITGFKDEEFSNAWWEAYKVAGFQNVDETIFNGLDEQMVRFEELMNQ